MCVPVLQLTQDTNGSLVSLSPSQVDDDVAELTFEWTPSARLDDAHEIAVHLYEIECRDRRGLEVHASRCPVFSAPGTSAQILKKLPPRLLCFSNEDNIGMTPNGIR